MNRSQFIKLFLAALSIYMFGWIAPEGIRAASPGSQESFIYVPNFDADTWKPAPKAPFDVKTFTGDTQKGLVVFGGIDDKQGAFMINVVNGQWEIIVDAPFSVKGSTGDNNYGPIVFGGPENRQVAYMRKYADNLWNKVTPAPFAIRDIAGDNQYGPIIVGGQDGKKVAYMRDYSTNKWNILADTPFEVKCITGTSAMGIIICGGQNDRQVAYMRKYADNVWNLVAEAPFRVTDITGTNETGPTVVGGDDHQQIAYMGSYSDNRWRMGAKLPNVGYRIAGSNLVGIVVGGLPSSKPKTIIKKVYKTAVVEFEERGDLGIQDAGAIIAEWMTTALNKTEAFEVYERLSLNTLMEEHKLGQTGLMDEASIAEVGRIRGVQAIVTGSVSKFGDIISVTAKVIDVETAKIIQTADIKVNSVNAISSEIDRLAWELAKE